MVDAAFDFTAQMHILCRDIASRMSTFQHVDMQRVVVGFSQTRRAHRWGLQAKLTPMRFEGGSLTTKKRGLSWTVQRVYHEGREMLYILTFYLPRFLNQSFDDKLVTVFHELFHIHPEFNGDLRRLDGHFHVHSRSQEQYDRHMAQFVRDYLRQGPPEEVLGFLRLNFGRLTRRHGKIVGLRLPVPKLIRLAQGSA